MKPLPSETVDLKKTPLSSLRSCSEYQTVVEKELLVEESKVASFWSFFKRNISQSRHKGRCTRSTWKNDEKEYFIEKFRFHSCNLIEDESPASYERLRSLASNRSKSSDILLRKLRASCDRGGDRLNGASGGLIEEVAWVLNYLLGCSSTSTPSPVMEIELRDLRPPQRLDHNSSLVEHGRGTEESVPLSPDALLTASETLIEGNREPVHDATNLDREYCIRQLNDFQRKCISFLRPFYSNNEAFYESIRIQPFSSGAYLRGMLLAGISSLSFQVYHLVTWPTLKGLDRPHELLQCMLYLNLIFQIVLNIVSMPNRLRIHFQCWESSRAVEMDSAIRLLRLMLRSDNWMLNKVLGQLLDLLSLFTVIVAELFLWFASVEDPLQNLIISLCATNLLMFVCRIVVATVFSLSVHDPAVLAEARKRGLSKWDLEVLPTFVFSRCDEVNNMECPICLESFELGDTLISLSCDKKHSFHSPCIRQWLQRQNSCPLCQKLV